MSCRRPETVRPRSSSAMAWFLVVRAVQLRHIARDEPPRRVAPRTGADAVTGVDRPVLPAAALHASAGEADGGQQQGDTSSRRHRAAREAKSWAAAVCTTGLRRHHGMSAGIIKWRWRSYWCWRLVAGSPPSRGALSNREARSQPKADGPMRLLMLRFPSTLNPRPIHIQSTLHRCSIDAARQEPLPP